MVVGGEMAEDRRRSVWLQVVHIQWVVGFCNRLQRSLTPLARRFLRQGDEVIDPVGPIEGVH